MFFTQRGRKTVLNIEELKRHAKNIAQNHRVLKRKKSSRQLLIQVEKNYQQLIRAYRRINEDVKVKKYIEPAAEWLLDNFHIIAEHVKEINYNLRYKYCGRLPSLESGPFKGLPRVYTIASEMVSNTDGRLDEEIITLFIKEYQSEIPLTIAELWAIPFMLRIALIKRIREITAYITEAQYQREKAEKWAKRLSTALAESSGYLQRVIREHDSTIDVMTPPYAEHLLQHLRDYGPETAPIIRWIDGKLALQGTTADEIIQREHQLQAAYQVSMGNAITSLRFLSGLKWEEIFEELSLVEQILNRDPDGIYSSMEFSSRDYYRHQVEKISVYSGTDELSVARKAIECAVEAIRNPDSKKRFTHVGYYLIGKGQRFLEEKLGFREKGLRKWRRWLEGHPTLFYLGSIGIIVLGAMTLFLYLVYISGRHPSVLSMVLAAIAAFIPIKSLSIGLVNWLITHIYPPHHLPKLEFKKDIPEEYRTMVIIPALLTGKKQVIELIEQMEVFYLANQQKNLYFALVGDFKDADNQEIPGDKEILDAAKNRIKELNKLYGRENGDLFFFFHRHRLWNPVQGTWMGWERKRGAILEFNRLLRGAEDTSYTTQVGDLSILPSIKFIITLDADTQLPRDTAKRLIGAMAHPLNRPVLDESLSRVIEGYGLLQPRIRVSADSASRSFFSFIFSGQSWADPYTTAVSDVYQDLFYEGIFTGKGIYDIDVFNKVLQKAFPENSILSHDLLEGAYIRTGLVTDIELVDGYPSNYIAHSMRLHRWVRGDWQLIPWLLPFIKDARKKRIRNPLTLITKWKIVDNLRRSLLPPALLITLICGTTVLPGSTLLWGGLAVLTLAFPFISDLAGAFLRYKQIYTAKRLFDIFLDVRYSIWQFLLSMIFLAYQSYLMIDAIARTLVRVIFTRKNMLEWVTAADAEKRSKEDIGYFLSKMWPCAAIALFSLIFSIIFNPAVWPLMLFLSSVWASAPWVAHKISKPIYKKTKPLSEEQIETLRRIARKTWRYFEEFIGPKDNWLPPDNYQQDPPIGVSHRTSPTNIGLALISTLAARDLGYIGGLETIERLEYTISSMTKLKRWNGHFYNWYNTITLAPLHPLYVSSVDSGNLAVYLITLKQGIEELLKKPLVGSEMLLGLRDTLMLVDDAIDNIQADSENITLTEWKTILDNLKGKRVDIDNYICSYEKEIEEFFPWTNLLEKIPEFLATGKITERLAELLDKLNRPVSPMAFLEDYSSIANSLFEIRVSLYREFKHHSRYREEAEAWFEQLKLNLDRSFISIKKFVHRCRALNEKIEAIVRDMNFRVLYDEKKDLFSIGYNVEEGKLTNSYYDLLASEARQTSFIAIAKGEVPQRHWFKLGRPLTMVDGSRTLLSWTGTMFEYLMPLLIMKNYEHTLLSETYRAVVRAQKEYGKVRRLPWGMSESGYYAFDLQKNYQYKAFGVPGLGLKRGLANDIVVSPYATLLALTIDPASSMKNIEMLIDDGLEGPYGFYEAIDYTPERLPQKKKGLIVKSFMVHHHGMSLLALDNYLNNNIMQKRFHAVPAVKATELLLQERMPKKEIFIKEYERKEGIRDLERKKLHDIRIKRKFATANTTIPETHLLSNGTHTVILTNSGGGFSHSQGIAVNRWREDPTRDSWGMYFYIQNLNSNTFWSATYQPCSKIPEDYQVTFEPDRAVFLRKDGNIQTRTEVAVSPEHNVEIRRISLTNHSKHGRVLEVTSYFETVIAPPAEDLAHPAFSNLFVETEFLPEYNTLLATRRPKNKKQKPIWLIHTLVLEGNGIGNIQYETDRLRFIGRGRDLTCPRAMEPEHPLSNTVGAVLDPIMSLRKRVKIGPGETARISFITATAESREEAVALAKEYQSHSVITRTFELAWTHSQIEMNYLNISSEQVNLFQKMASHIIFPGPTRRFRENEIKNNRKGQSGLWGYGISGDNPIVLVQISKLDHMKMVRQILTAHEYWRFKGLNVDLVLLNEYGNSYEQPVQDRIRDLISISHARDLQNKPGGIFLIQADSLPDEDRYLLLASARLIFSGESGSISAQLKAIKPDKPLPPILKAVSPPAIASPSPEDEQHELLFFNQIGGFSKEDREYIIRLRNEHYTPMPWCNIISNPLFGFLVTESGSSYTWYGNSRENKLTPWSNDPIVDPSGEIIYLRDEDTGQFWSITPLPVREDEPYTVRHGHGYSVFEHNSHGIKQKQLMFVPLDKPVKIYHITLKNESKSSRKITVTYYVEWVMGAFRHRNAPFTVTDHDERTGAILARNRYNEEFAGCIAFMFANLPKYTFTGDRTEFIGRNGSYQKPAALKRERLSGRSGAGYDPCGAIMAEVDLKPGEQKDVLFLLGQGKDLEEVNSLINNYGDINMVQEAFQRVKDFWKDKLTVLQVNTPDPSMDLLLNGWLIYQTLACRLWARTAFYQASGAYGFRDQLQDAMALVYSNPELLREQIIKSAGHQFQEGDVQHWWHPPFRGVRTRITDDLLFLPYVTAEYIEKTGDFGILEEKIHFLKDQPLEPDERERYNIPQVSEEKATLYEHCIRAIDRSLCFGKHGLPLIGTGDWNDGMDSVGEKGKGESIWLGWFLYTTLDRFIPICRARKDKKRAERYEKVAAELVESIEKNGWDGGWYRRAYFDDGTPLGSEHNEECRIDSISQSWSVISGAGKLSRTREAMRALEHYLINREEGFIKLLTPPFDKSPLEPGYIKGYVPGVRENGGQYTHAAVWTVLAFTKMGDGNKAWELFHMINPVNHTRTPIELCKYKVEPYVTSADVYTVPPHTGRGGWTWYTGSAGWMYRVGIEWILGFKLRGNRFTIAPCIPKEWREYTINYRFNGTLFHIRVLNPEGINHGVKAIFLDGKKLPGGYVPLTDDGVEHEVQVVLGQSTSRLDSTTGNSS